MGMWIWILSGMIMTGLFTYALICGAVSMISPEYQAILDDEQAEMIKRSIK